MGNCKHVLRPLLRVRERRKNVQSETIFVFGFFLLKIICFGNLLGVAWSGLRSDVMTELLTAMNGRYDF